MYNYIIGIFITISSLLILFIPYFIVLFIENTFLNDINNDLIEFKENIKK